MTAQTTVKFDKMFDDDACHGDTLEWSPSYESPILVRCRLEYDDLGRPMDYDCYTDDQVESWRNDEWWFGRLVCEAFLVDGCQEASIPDCFDSVGCIEVNFLGNNEHITEWANSLLVEVVSNLPKALREMAASAERAAADMEPKR